MKLHKGIFRACKNKRNVNEDSELVGLRYSEVARKNTCVSPLQSREAGKLK